MEITDFIFLSRPDESFFTYHIVYNCIKVEQIKDAYFKYNYYNYIDYMIIYNILF